MRVAVIRFPASNCDQDAYHAVRDDLGLDAGYVWHEETSLAAFDAVVLPGGFAYGDYLRCGAIAARAPIMDEVRRFAVEGRPVLGICNGFQVLCESGLLPGALMRNARQRFLCRDVFLRAENRRSFWTEAVDRVLRLPIAHGEGRYVVDAKTLAALEESGRIAFRYVAPNGQTNPDFNLNGSVDAIAGVLNESGNVLGLMPHPERAMRESLGSADGSVILRGLTRVLASK